MADVPDIVAAVKARDDVLSAVRYVRLVAAHRLSVSGVVEMPHANTLEAAFKQLDAGEKANPTVATVRRGTLYGVLSGGFASHWLRSRLLQVSNDQHEPIGEIIFSWMNGQLQRYQIDLRVIEVLDSPRAVDWCTKAIRGFLMMNLNVVVCDPENLVLHACRRPNPGDAEYITTITTAGDFPRTINQLARTFDPRRWDKRYNPYAVHFEEVYPVTDYTGTTIANPPERIGESWSGWILEWVKGLSGSYYMKNTLTIQFAVISTWIKLTYGLGQTTDSSPSSVTMEQDFGYITADEILGRPGWSRVQLEKNIRFSGNPGTPGGPIGWGDLPNMMAPDLVAHWLEDMRDMTCWTPSS